MFFNRLKSGFSLSDRYKIFTSNWLWSEICENVVLSKIRLLSILKFFVYCCHSNIDFTKTYILTNFNLYW